jgi:hypothetical protein
MDEAAALLNLSPDLLRQHPVFQRLDRQDAYRFLLAAFSHRCGHRVLAALPRVLELEDEFHRACRDLSRETTEPATCAAQLVMMVAEMPRYRQEEICLGFFARMRALGHDVVPGAEEALLMGARRLGADMAMSYHVAEAMRYVLSGVLGEIAGRFELYESQRLCALDPFRAMRFASKLWFEEPPALERLKQLAGSAPADVATRLARYSRTVGALPPTVSPARKVEALLRYMPPPVAHRMREWVLDRRPALHEALVNLRVPAHLLLDRFILVDFVSAFHRNHPLVALRHN